MIRHLFCAGCIFNLPRLAFFGFKHWGFFARSCTISIHCSWRLFILSHFQGDQPNLFVFFVLSSPSSTFFVFQLCRSFFISFYFVTHCLNLRAQTLIMVCIFPLRAFTSVWRGERENDFFSLFIFSFSFVSSSFERKQKSALSNRHLGMERNLFLAPCCAEKRRHIIASPKPIDILVDGFNMWEHSFFLCCC